MEIVIGFQAEPVNLLSRESNRCVVQCFLVALSLVAFPLVPEPRGAKGLWLFELFASLLGIVALFNAFWPPSPWKKLF
jgi:hypothetical protein